MRLQGSLQSGNWPCLGEINSAQPPLEASEPHLTTPAAGGGRKGLEEDWEGVGSRGKNEWSECQLRGVAHCPKTAGSPAVAWESCCQIWKLKTKLVSEKLRRSPGTPKPPFCAFAVILTTSVLLFRQVTFANENIPWLLAMKIQFFDQFHSCA